MLTVISPAASVAMTWRRIVLANECMKVAKDTVGMTCSISFREWRFDCRSDWPAVRVLARTLQASG